MAFISFIQHVDFSSGVAVPVTGLIPGLRKLDLGRMTVKLPQASGYEWECGENAEQ